MNEMQKKPDIKNIKVAKTSKGKLIILAGCAVFDSKELILVKEQESSVLSTSLEIKGASDKILVVAPFIN